MHLRGDIQVRIGQASEKGPKEKNEDCLGVRIPKDETLATKGIAAVISDGVSAASQAKEASEASVLGFLNDYYETPEPWEVKTAGHRVLSALNRWLFSQGLGHSSEEKGFVCTFTALILKSHTAHLFHIGDSRLYRLRNGQLETLSNDHSTPSSDDSTYLTRAMGLVHSPQIDYSSFELEQNDIFLLTTDGIHDEIPHAHIQKILLNSSAEEAADKLADAAKESKDNRSCIVLHVDSLPDSNQNEVFRRLSRLPFPPDLSPGVVIDGYTVERIIAATKNTQLYVVRDEETDHTLVMKTPSVSFQDDPSYLERFALEEWIGLRTKHPNLARAIKPPRPRTHCYYLLEHIPGITLARWCELNPNPPIDKVVGLVEQIISGTRALHRVDTLHQDLKPANILVLPGSTIKIIDYGSCYIGGISEIASPFDRHSALGTLDFSAPEYRYGARPSSKSDLFSIAALTYYLITNQQLPYGAPWDRAKTLHDFINLQYVSATQHNPMVPLWFDAALKKTLAPTPGARHETMSEFLHDLKKPNYSLLNRNDLPFIEKNPLLFWKITSAVLLLALIVSHLLR